jgi:hypothetical protein
VVSTASCTTVVACTIMMQAAFQNIAGPDQSFFCFSGFPCQTMFFKRGLREFEDA